MNKGNVIRLYICSFCGFSSREVQFIVNSQIKPRVSICDKCIVTAQELVDDRKKENESKQG